MKMEKMSRRLVLVATTSIFLLLPLRYATVFQWKASLLDLRKRGDIGSNTGIEERDSQSFLLRRLVRGKDRIELDATGYSCDSDLHSEVCVTKEPVRIDTCASTVYLSSKPTLSHLQRAIRPYARKEDETAMQTITPLELLRDANSPPPCNVTHNVPAVIFSSGGFTGNLFHEFNEIIIPLFLTCRHFRSQLQFIITDFKPWWVSKYHRILTHLSHYDVVNPTEDGRVHCFPGAVIGLKYHDNLACNTTSIPGGYSLIDFKRFLQESFGLRVSNLSKLDKPVLMLISRQNSRKFYNEDDIVGLAKELGFRVVVATPDQMSNLDKFSGVVNSCSVLVGAHGAGLTNALFLPEGGVLVQVMPLGLDWASKAYFGGPAREMGLHYLEYRISPEESSLAEMYGRDHPIVTDPMSIHMQGYRVSRAVYIDGQNLRLNLVRFRETLVEAMKLVGRTEV